jgi:CO/xanthine dehydrogenase FAD-binding subunit
MFLNYARPTSLREALSLLAESRMMPLAGGTDIYPAMANGAQIEALLDVTQIGEFDTDIAKRDGVWVIPPLATWTAIAQADLPAQFVGLQAAAVEVGGRQVQNRGTVVGNVCNASPAADGIVALMALDARVRLASRAGERVLPLSDFVLGNRETRCRADELVTRIEVPDWGARTAGAFRKLGARRYLVISIAMVGATLTIDADARITRAAVAVGSCSARAVRLARVEQALVGERLDRALPAKAARLGMEGLSPIDDVRASARYRHAAARELVVEALESCRVALLGKS